MEWKRRKILILQRKKEGNSVALWALDALSLDDQKAWKEEKAGGFKQLLGGEACSGFLNSHRLGRLLIETSSRRGDGQ